MEKVEFSPISGFVGQGYVQHAGSEWCEEHCIRYHTYLVPESYYLWDAVAFAYNDGAALGSKKGAVSIERCFDRR